MGWDKDLDWDFENDEEVKQIIKTIKGINGRLKKQVKTIERSIKND